MNRASLLTALFLFVSALTLNFGTISLSYADEAENKTVITKQEVSDTEEGRKERTVYDIKQNNAIDKLGRGLSNIVLAPWEIPKQIMKETDKSNGFYGATSGTFVGLGRTVLRVAVGAVEVATFLVPFPTSYNPVMRPAYVFQDDKAEEETELVEE